MTEDKHSKWYHKSSSKEVVCIDTELVRKLILSLDVFDLEMCEDDQSKYFNDLNTIFGHLDKIRETMEKQGYTE